MFRMCFQDDLSFFIFIEYIIDCIASARHCIFETSNSQIHILQNLALLLRKQVRSPNGTYLTGEDICQPLGFECIRQAQSVNSIMGGRGVLEDQI